MYPRLEEISILAQKIQSETKIGNLNTKLQMNIFSDFLSKSANSKSYSAFKQKNFRLLLVFSKPISTCPNEHFGQ